jgi:hypothetical protein
MSAASGVERRCRLEGLCLSLWSLATKHITNKLFAVLVKKTPHSAFLFPVSKIRRPVPEASAISAIQRRHLLHDQTGGGDDDFELITRPGRAGLINKLD